MSQKGKVNIWDCPECGKGTVAIDIDEGVTPFMLDCRVTPGCPGTAQSRFYRVPDPPPAPAWEWFMPTPEEARHYSKEMKEHFDMGGLAIRKIAEKPGKVLIVGDDSPGSWPPGRRSRWVPAPRPPAKEAIDPDELLRKLTSGTRPERRRARKLLDLLERLEVAAGKGGR